MSDNTRLQVQLREALDRAGITQRELAKRMGVTEGRVSRLFNAENNPTWESVSRIAEACGLRLHVRFCHCSDSGGFVCSPCKERAEQIVAGAAPPQAGLDPLTVEERRTLEWVRAEMRPAPHFVKLDCHEMKTRARDLFDRLLRLSDAPGSFDTDRDKLAEVCRIIGLNPRAPLADLVQAAQDGLRLSDAGVPTTNATTTSSQISSSAGVAPLSVTRELTEADLCVMAANMITAVDEGFPVRELRRILAGLSIPITPDHETAGTPTPLPRNVLHECRLCSAGGWSSAGRLPEKWGQLVNVDGPVGVCRSCCREPTALDALVADYPNVRLNWWPEAAETAGTAEREE